MKVTVFLSDGGKLEALPEQQKFATFEMDAGTVLVNTDHIVRIDLD